MYLHVTAFDWGLRPQTLLTIGFAAGKSTAQYIHKLTVM